MVRTLCVAASLMLTACVETGGVFAETAKIVPDREVYAARLGSAAADATIATEAKALCAAGADWCMVFVMREGSPLPTGVPLTEKEEADHIGTYTLNRTTGVDEFRR